MRAALTLGESYAAHAERVYGEYGSTSEARMALRALKWIQETGRGVFSERDLYRALGVRKGKVVEALKLLEETGHVRLAADVPDRTEAGRGRKSSPLWEVNPSLRRDSVESVNSVSEVRT